MMAIKLYFDIYSKHPFQPQTNINKVKKRNTHIIGEMSDGLADAHLQIECEKFAFVAATNTLNPCGDDRLVVFTLHIDNQKEQTELSDLHALTEILALECVAHEKFVVRALQSILKQKTNRHFRNVKKCQKI